MTDHHPADRPGHLDIDAVSAFVDRDLEPDELTTIEIHLHECPACHREVLEIRTTVVLLAGLPQYTPRRSFCLGHEHARAARRRRLPRGALLVRTLRPAGYPASAASAVTHARGWSRRGVAAGTAGGGDGDRRAAPAGDHERPHGHAAPARGVAFGTRRRRCSKWSTARHPPPSRAPPAAPAHGGGEATATPASLRPAPTPEPSFGVASNASEGTTSGDSASQEMLEDAETANTALERRHQRGAGGGDASGPHTRSGARAESRDGDSRCRRAGGD